METHSSSVNRSLDERCTGDQSIMLPTSSTSIVSRSTSALHAARMFGTHNRHNQSEDLAPPPNKKLPRIWRRSVPRAKIPHWFLKMFCGIEHSGEARARWFLKCFLNLAIVFVVICVVGLALWASILYLDTAENAASPPKDSLTRGVLGIGRALGLTRHYTNRRLAALARMEHMRDANRINVTTVASALAGGLKKLTDILALSREQRSSLISGSHRDFQLEYAQRLIATLLDEQKQVPNKAHVEVQRKDTELLPKLAKFLIRCANLKRGSPSANSEYLRACTSSLLPPSEEKDGRDKQHGGFEAVEPGQRTEEEESRFPFDEMALLQYRYAAGHQRRSGTDSHSGDMHLEQKSGKVHLGNYSKADLYQLPSVLNRRFYYPVRRWARANPFSPHSFAATDAWYSAVVSNVLYYCSGSVAKRVFTQRPSFLHIEPLSPTRNQDIKELFSSHHRTRLPSRTPDADTVTLFVSFASFRDEECSPTLLDLLQKAKNVHRVFVGVAKQNDPSDQFSCLPPELRDKVIPCYAQGSARTDGQEEQEARKRVLGVEATSEDPEFVLDFSRRVCFLGEHLRYRRVPAVTARGPTYGRFLSMLLYGGETMAMVLDSHNRFVPHWDSYIVHMHHKMHDPMAVLSHYPESYPYDKPGQIKKFDFLRSSTAYLCQAKFVKEFGFIRLGAIVIGDQQRFAVNNEYNRPYVMTSQQEPVSSEPNDKLPQPWIAGGFLFARASFLREVPFDPHLPYLFDGEEVLFSVRLWTHGYNMYSPERNVAYHFYGRPKAPKVWGMNPSWPAIQASSRERVNYLLHSLQVGLSTNSPAGPRRRRKRQPVSALPAKVRPRRVQLNFSNEDAFVIPRNTTLAHVVVDLERYGMGSVRTVEEWYKYAGIDRAQQKLDGRWCGP